MSYKKYIEDNLGVKLRKNEYTKRKYLNYLEDLKYHADVLVPNDDIIKHMEENNSGAIMEYAISMCGGDSSDIDMDDINIFIQRLNNGYNLVKYIEEVRSSK